MMHLTWDILCRGDHDILSFEDPLVASFHCPIDDFLSTYAPILQLLNGDCPTNYVDFFYMPSPMNTTQMVFRDEKVQLKFRNWAIKLGLIPSLKKMMTGD